MIINETAKSLEEQVYLVLEESIIAGEYKPGEALTEMSLSKKLGVSRTPIRAALGRLSKEGLIEISPNRGAVVVGVSDEDLSDVYRIRMRLEGLASAMAATRISDEEKKELLESLELSEFYLGKGDTEKLKELDTAFHKIIYKASGSRTMCKILSDLHQNIRSYRKLSLTVPGRLEKSISEHREIYNAIAGGSADDADKLTSEHIERAMQNTLLAIKKCD
jgi:DNA-binding GntR family transcriptional regulator